MTDYLFTVILNAAKPPRQVAPLRHATRATSPASTGEHTPGRVVFGGVYTTVISSPQVLPFQAILRKFAQDDNIITVIARERSDRGNPED